MGAVCLRATFSWWNQTDVGKLGIVTSALIALSLCSLWFVAYRVNWELQFVSCCRACGCIVDIDSTLRGYVEPHKTYVYTLMPSVHSRKIPWEWNQNCVSCVLLVRHLLQRSTAIYNLNIVFGPEQNGMVNGKCAKWACESELHFFSRTVLWVVVVRIVWRIGSLNIVRECPTVCKLLYCYIHTGSVLQSKCDHIFVILFCQWPLLSWPVYSV